MNTHLITHVTMNDIIHNGLNVHAQVGVVTGGCGHVHAQVGVINAQTSHPQISPVLSSSCLSSGRSMEDPGVRPIGPYLIIIHKLLV